MIRSLIVATVLVAGAACADPGCDNAMTQHDINICAGKRFETADRELNVLYHRALAVRRGDGARERLRTSERDWIRSRDEQCEREAAPYEGGSMRPTVQLGCLERLTRARAKEIRDQCFTDGRRCP